MSKTFIIYIPGSSLSEFHKLSPWIQFPLTFSHLDYNSILICGKCTISDINNFKIHETLVRGDSTIKSIFEPFLAFKKIISERPDIVMISPIGSYLATVMPLMLFSKLILGKKHKTRFVLKSDWSLDYYGFPLLKKILVNTFLVLASYVFDIITVETYCGFNKAINLPIIRAKRLRRLPIGLPDDSISVERYDNGKRKNVIICVARIARMKDQLTLIKAFSKVSESYKDWKLILAGPITETNYKSELEFEIRNLGIQNRVEFTGFLSETGLFELYKTASIFCLPSRFLESAGQVKYEAISAGLPVISTDIPCRKDNEELGIIVFDSGDFDQLSRILTKLMRDEKMRREVSAYSQTKIVSYKELVQDLIDF